MQRILIFYSFLYENRVADGQNSGRVQLGRRAISTSRDEHLAIGQQGRCLEVAIS